MPSLKTETNEAPLEERQLKLSVYNYLKTRACIDNPVHHALHEFDQTTRDLHAPTPNGRGGMTRPLAPPIDFKVEAAMASAEINAELVCPLRRTLNFPPRTHDYDAKKHNLIEGMISRQEAPAMFNEYRETQGSHDEVYTDDSKINERVGAAAVINRLFQNTRQQHHLCCRSYSHQSGTELLPVFGSSSSQCSSKCPLRRSDATGQLLYPAVGLNQVGCSCTWQRSLSCETTLGPPKKFQHLARAEEVVITQFELAIPRPLRPISCHQDRRLLVIVVVKAYHWPYAPGVFSVTGKSWWILQSWLIEYSLRDRSRDLHNWIPVRSRILLSDLSDQTFYAIPRLNHHRTDAIILTSTSPQTWTI